VIALIAVLRLSSTSSLPHAPYFDGPKPYVIARQGGDALRPGNTLLALRHAFALGADVLEMDLHATLDGVVVVMHDARVDRTTNGTGLIGEMPYAEVAKLDAGYRWPYEGSEHPWRGRGLTVPTLEQVLTEFPEARFNVDIKQSDPSIANDVCRLLRRHGASDRSLVASIHEDAIVEFRRNCPEVPTAASESEMRWFMFHRYARLMPFYQPTAHALQLPLTWSFGALITPEVTAAATKKGMFVDASNVNDEATMRRLIGEGVAGIITDRPDLLLEVLGRRR
jgi:glycerophosphoryl diester phosphodiesterase